LDLLITSSWLPPSNLTIFHLPLCKERLFFNLYNLFTRPAGLRCQDFVCHSQEHRQKDLASQRTIQYFIPISHTAKTTVNSHPSGNNDFHYIKLTPLTSKWMNEIKGMARQWE
jgi:hypothetical protein